MTRHKAHSLKQELRNLPEPHLVLIEQFFDGNEDAASIGKNLTEHPGLAEFQRVLTGLLQREDVEAVYAEISELDPGPDAWPFTNSVLVVGTIAQPELAALLAPLKPDEVGTQDEEKLAQQVSAYHRAPVMVAWWD